jgi:hypothetical protein
MTDKIVPFSPRDAYLSFQFRWETLGGKEIDDLWKANEIIAKYMTPGHWKPVCRAYDPKAVEKLAEHDGHKICIQPDGQVVAEIFSGGKTTQTKQPARGSWWLARVEEVESG